jgi:tetratricopeptide (TPR) repeat protein
MKTSIKKLALFTFILSLAFLFAGQSRLNQDDLLEGIRLAENALKAYDKGLLVQAKEIFAKEESNTMAFYYQTYCEYKLLEMSLRPGNEDLFDKYYEDAVAHAEQIAAVKEYESEGKTLLAGIYMMKIATSSMSAVTLSPKVHSLLDDAQKSDPGNPRPYIIRGTMKYQTPGIFGGSYEDAAKNFSKAIQLFEKQENVDSLKPHWGYIESLAWLGRSQEKLENYDAAKFAYQKALNVEPNYGWVKYSLLPQLMKKLNDK